MPGRLPESSGRWRRVRIGVIAAAAATVSLLSTSGLASAAPAPVIVTMGVTGATSSNCGGLSTGGSAVWVTPDGELDFKTTVVGVNLLGLKLGLLDISAVANLGGTLVIDPGGAARTYKIDASRNTKVTPLSPGDHNYTFAFDRVTLLSLASVQLNSLLPRTGVANAGVQLTYAGTIHVTTDAARCGVALQLPGPVVSASVTGLPPLVVSVAPVTVPTIPITLPTLLQTTPKPAPSGSAVAQPASPGAPGSSPAATAGPTPTPTATRTPGTTGGGGSNGGSGPQASAPPAIRPSDVGLTGVLVGAVQPPGGAATRGGQPGAESGGGLPVGELQALLAILAIMAFSLDSAAYAKRYLLRPVRG